VTTLPAKAGRVVTERAIKHGFEDWGAQLKYIRDNHLYLAFAANCTWEQYTQERWEITPQRAGQMIQAFDRVKEMQKVLSQSEKILSLPARESHVTALAALPDPKQRVEVWEHVLEHSDGHGITAKLVAAEVERYQAALSKNYITLEEWAKKLDFRHGIAYTGRVNTY
jgi:hypothetical protein